MPPLNSYKARGIVLHTLRYGEKDLIVYMLTDTVGRRTYMARGARGGRGRLASLLQPMFPLEFEGLESPKMDMHRLKDIRCATPLHSTPFDIRKSTISLFMAETLYRVVKESEPRSPLFDFVFEAVQTLDELEEGVANFHLWFLAKLSSHLGFHPSNEYIPGCWFDIREGCFTPVRPTHNFAFDTEATRLLNRFMECGRHGLGEIELSRGQRASFMTSMTDYFSYHLDAVGEIKSIRILREVF